jgi:type VI protein secretion system component Hcp
MAISRCFILALALSWLPAAAAAASDAYIQIDGIENEVGYQPSVNGRMDILTYNWGKGSPGTKVRTVVPVEPMPGPGHLTVSLPATPSTRALEHYCGYKKLPALSLFLPKAGGMGQYTEYRLEDIKVNCLPTVGMGGPHMMDPVMGDPGMHGHGKKGYKNGHAGYGHGKHGMAVQEFQFSYARLKKQ